MTGPTTEHAGRLRLHAPTLRTDELDPLSNAILYFRAVGPRRTRTATIEHAGRNHPRTTAERLAR